MSDKNLNNVSGNPFDNVDLFESQNSLIIDHLEQISNGIYAIQRHESPTLAEVPHLLDLSRTLMVSELEVAVIALVALSNPDCESVNEKFLVKSLMPFFQGRRAPIQQAIQALITERLIHRDLESDVELPCMIKFDVGNIPQSISITGIPDFIEIKGSIPSEINLKMPENPEIEMVYKGSPIEVKVELDYKKILGDENGEDYPCFAIIPCKNKRQ